MFGRVTHLKSIFFRKPLFSCYQRILNLFCGNSSANLATGFKIRMNLFKQGKALLTLFS